MGDSTQSYKTFLTSSMPPLPITPFSYSDLRSLIEFLTYHSQNTTAPGFTVSLNLVPHDYTLSSLLFPAQQNPISIFKVATEIHVDTIKGLEELFHYPGTVQVQTVIWKGMFNSRLTINCLERTVKIYTDSISFMELCRHKLMRKGVHQFTVELPMN